MDKIKKEVTFGSGVSTVVMANGVSITFEPRPGDQDFKSARVSTVGWIESGTFRYRLSYNKDGNVNGEWVKIDPDPKDAAHLPPVVIDNIHGGHIIGSRIDSTPSPKRDALLAVCGVLSNYPGATHMCLSCRKPVTPNTYNFGDRMRDFCPTCGEEVTE
jgi:hypothetical protein